MSTFSLRLISSDCTGGAAASPRPSDGAFSSALPPTPVVQSSFSADGSSSPHIPGSTKIPIHPSLQTPRISNTPKLHQRKDSGHSIANPPTSSIWSRLFTNQAPSKQPLPSPRLRSPSHLDSIGTRPLTSRPYFDQRQAGPGAPPSLLILLRNIILRPFYILSRRGPIVPIVTLIIILAIFFTKSTSSRSQSVKLKVQGAFGPYIPQRAAQAFDWAGNSRQQPRDAADSRQSSISGGKQGSVPGLSTGGNLDIKELPRSRKDGRIVLKEGKQHPIPLLMKRARAQWEALKARQSKTFAEAVKEYIRRYGRRPPKGFDQW